MHLSDIIGNLFFITSKNIYLVSKIIMGKKLTITVYCKY